MSMRRDIEFLYEIGSLRFIPRQWKRFLNADFANLSEHHIRVMWLALIIAKNEKIKDTEKIIKMALVHDIAESRTGDADYLSRQYVKRDEELGIKDMLKNTSLEAEFIGLWQEYEAKKSTEAQVVKDADTLDIDLELHEQHARGFNLKSVWRHQRKFVRQNKFYTKTARRMVKELDSSEPHSWHINARNRINDGDWKK